MREMLDCKWAAKKKFQAILNFLHLKTYGLLWFVVANDYFQAASFSQQKTIRIFQKIVQK